MPDIYDDNLTINPGTGGAVVATDYYSDAHYQVVKIAFGNTGEANRVSSSNGLPVTVENSTIDVQLTSVASGTKIGINGNVAVFGVAGATAVGVTASDLDIRSLTAGDPSTGLAAGADFVRVVGLSGAWPVGVTASNFGIRALTAGDPTTAGAVGQDTVRIVGYSGGWPIGVTAVDLDIRSLTYGFDSVSVLNTVSVESTEDPFVYDPYFGFQTRLLRATTGPNAAVNGAALSAGTIGAEDAVRVIGLSGAWPVNTFSHGLTNINNYDTKLPLHVDSTGALYVNLASGTISVTADVGSISIGDVTISGISLGYPSDLSNTLPIRGYTGADTVPVAVTGSVNIIGTGLTYLSNISNNTMRVLGASGDYIGITGDVRDKINSIEFSTVNSQNFLKTSDQNSSNILSIVASVAGSASNLAAAFGSTSLKDSSGNVKVSVQSIAQPTGGTSGRIGAPSGSATQMGTSTLQSGIHFKSDLTNTGTVFVGFNSQVSSQIGFPLYAGDQIFIETDNLNKMFVSSTVNGSTVYYIGT